MYTKVHFQQRLTIPTILTIITYYTYLLFLSFLDGKNLERTLVECPDDCWAPTSTSLFQNVSGTLETWLALSMALEWMLLRYGRLYVSHPSDVRSITIISSSVSRTRECGLS